MFACLILIFEIEYFMTADLASFHHPFFSAVYFTVITLSTIGYGDYSPTNMPGRTIVMLAAIWGSILLSLFVTVVSGLFEMSDNERKAIELINVSRKAASVISKGFKYHQAK